MHTHTLVKCRPTGGSALHWVHPFHNFNGCCKQSKPTSLPRQQIYIFIQEHHIKMKIRFRQEYSFDAPMTFCESNNEKGKKTSNKHYRWSVICHVDSCLPDGFKRSATFSSSILKYELCQGVRFSKNVCMDDILA